MHGFECLYFHAPLAALSFTSFDGLWVKPATNLICIINKKNIILWTLKLNEIIPGILQPSNPQFNINISTF